jgi:hypothetical protein
MKPSPSSCASCAVCGLSDARALTEIRLADGSRPTVCGTHALIAQRTPGLSNVAALCEAAAERRDRHRRGKANDLSADSLSAQLSDAFAGGRRKSADRRAS